MPTYELGETPGSEELYAELTTLLAKITGWKFEDIKHICYVIANEDGYQVGGCKHSLMILHKVVEQDSSAELIRAMLADRDREN